MASTKTLVAEVLKAATPGIEAAIAAAVEAQLNGSTPAKKGKGKKAKEVAKVVTIGFRGPNSPTPNQLALRSTYTVAEALGVEPTLDNRRAFIATPKDELVAQLEAAGFEVNVVSAASLPSTR